MSLRRSIYKSPAQMRLMIAPGLATAASLDAARAAIRVGATTLELDAAAEAAIVARGGLPNFKLEQGYHHTVCASVNEDVVHGIPGARVLAAGDIVSIDSGAIIDGWNGDAAFSFVIPDPARPEVVAEREKLSHVTEQSLWHGIARLAVARHLNEVGDAIEDYVESQGDYGILTDYVGHGIGRSMHEAPPVFNYRVRQKGPDVKPGLVIAIEPMVVMGSIETFVRDDDWTVATSDGLAAAHWEHSVAVHKDGIWVLTAADGGAAGLAPLGITPVPLP
ncbi:type I methionyl aminopeptidase [Cryobacterium sp. TMT1-62]|uniref:Methionine aminopeptidase n=1 Tax=Cryobacterium sandaracinum TaxID=1259247 RepID=A0ABY2JE10_9MICO|nr:MULTISPECIES: type I methionyl aminopeptidase [Cryobacterium]TFB52897.1 type I methionyl aminopeptidase [Cryobacterium sp. Sr3]TFC49866.1 type I methionyl aminopeptidase [Cryobacterium sp. TMT2-17-1]TFC66653.1 type I methionyl aminopeptidase [Cryobacterium sp. TMT2-4]TFD03364.1 type I methionyl aminopeptidase [Cryobacterium sandaracinum]TFD35530.1 type I methionyl aminopeptidase [Cryobacterium sp. TMT1-62]